MLVLRGDRVHVAGHLDRPQPAVRIEVDDDGVRDHRLAGDELDVVARGHRERLHRIGGRQHGRLPGRGPGLGTGG